MMRTHSRSARIGLLAVLALLASFVLASPVAAQAETSDVTLIKVDAMTGDPIAGACFELWEADATEATYGPECTDDAGEAFFAAVEHGDYTIVESTVPPGYAPLGDQPLTVEGEMAVTLENEPTTITVNKFDGETGEPLADACFVVTNNDEGGDGTFTSDVQCTDETGTTVFTHIEFGDYRVYEQSPPPGYEQNLDPAQVTLSAEQPHVAVEFPNTAMVQGGFLLIQKLNCQGVDEAEIRLVSSETSMEEAELVSDYPGFQTCAFGEGTFEITGGDLAAPIILHTDVFGTADVELDAGTYEIRETAPNQAGPEEFVVEDGEFWGALVLNPMPAGQTPNVPAGGAPLPNTAEANVPGAPLAITMLAIVGLSVVGMTVRNVADRRRR